MLPAARRLEIGIVPYSPLGRGFLTGAVVTDTLEQDDLRRGDPRFTGPALEHNQALVAEVRRVAAERGGTPGQLALAWLLAQGEDVPIPGTKRRERLEENAAAAEIALSPPELERLEAAAPRAAWSGDRQSFSAYHTARASA